MQTLTLITPDDWHCHLRDGTPLQRTVPDQARIFSRSIVMPNLVPPVTTIEQAQAYYQRIMQHQSADSAFKPLMTLFLNSSITSETLHAMHAVEYMTACKYYPAGATTHSNAGAASIQSLRDQLTVMQQLNIPLLVHGESIDSQIDIFDREAHFLKHELSWVLNTFPDLRVVIEHVSTRQAADFVKQAGENVAATVTPHHLLLNRNDMLMGGIRPDYYCLPILKTAQDQHALIEAVISGHPRFFLGTDSAPHAKSKKYNACGCAGIYSAPCALELYAEVFDRHNAMDKLESFASLNGPRFYQLADNQTSMTLIKQPWQVPEELPYNNETITPFYAGKTLQWQIQT
ncbi:MAG: dihydroorotase [Coxiellaceae bacterium]|nr:dihydroorotase [Coxiellaceae bacterium]